jgi:hypothetical protein
MKKFLLPFCLTVALLCGFTGSSLRVSAQGISVIHDPIRQEQIVQRNRLLLSAAEEQQRLATGSTVAAPQSQERISGHRTLRTNPTYGGKNSRSIFHPNGFNLSNFNLVVLQLLCQHAVRLWTGVKSPRDYYVIMLGRFLC